MKSVIWRLLLPLLLLVAATARAEVGKDVLPAVSWQEALTPAWFPSRMHAFVWRNWTVVPAERLAWVVGTSPENITDIALSMGLEKQRGGSIQNVWNSPKGYITVLRRNWHLLPYKQLMQLLGLTENELAWRLKEDDFLWVKLGSMKPKCDVLTYSAPTAQQQAKAGQISQWVKEIKRGKQKEVPRFDFYGEPEDEPVLWKNDSTIRMVFSYSSEFGDPLLDSTLSSYPDVLLRRLAARGINALWIHSVLSTLVPETDLFPGDALYDVRRRHLRKLIDRAARYGIRIFLYSNEPRAAHRSFFDRVERQAFKGVQEGDQYALCTSDVRTLKWLENAYKDLFTEVKGLGGVFTITASENLTSCASHGHQAECLRCKERNYAEIIAEVNNAIARGVHAANEKAEVIVWDWQWKEAEVEQIIEHLTDKRILLMSVSEWGLPIARGGVKTTVGEYSISSVGPSQRSLNHWEMARRSGLRTMAKVQVGTTWELGSVPYIPAMELITQHARRLSLQHMDGMMLSWSLGGYPSVNMDLFLEAFADQDFRLEAAAEQRYGRKAGKLVAQAWHLFSEGMAEFPFSGATVYNAPQHMGPANPFYADPTGYRATMVGLPYDDLGGWRSIYPVEVYTQQMERVATGFEQGMVPLRKALKVAGGQARLRLKSLARIAQAVALHYRSVVNQARFTAARNELLQNPTLSAEEREVRLQQMHHSVESELETVLALLPLVREDATIGYESSNQYFYIEQDLLEKYINLKDVQLLLEKQPSFFLSDQKP